MNREIQLQAMYIKVLQVFRKK